MPPRVALVTPAPLDRAFGDSLRPLMQARGLWEIGWRDFVVFTPRPDPSLPFEQETLRTAGPLQLAPNFRHGCALVHAHQNAGLFLEGRIWPDLHGFAPLESSLALGAHPVSPRALGHYLFSRWATRRLARRAERILCAADSIAKNVVETLRPRAPVDVLLNAIDPEDYPRAVGADPAVLAIGGFISRWGRTSFPLALETAKLCPELPFRLVGAMDEAQEAACAAEPNIEATRHLSMTDYKRALRVASIALIPFADWCRGGGARQKVIQAAASGLAIAATPSALEGIGGSGKQGETEGFKIASTPAGLTEALRQLAGDPAQRQRLGDALRLRFLLEYDYRKEAQKLAELYDAALRSSK